jgi:cytochrome bd ubiquinol oxidase subunit II
MIVTALMFTGLAILLYVLLGGADFGAGILEIFTGRKSINTISKAIAPVWEANHIWLIVVIVILFNAFPQVYSTLLTYLHIPIMIALFGIIFRGTAFTFRYYDPYEDRTHEIYSFVFKLFSLLTPFFLGITLGAVIMGNISTDSSLSFSSRFVEPWFNWFSASIGIFIVILFAFLAAVYLAVEPAEEDTRKLFVKYAKILLIGLVIFGVIVFLMSEIYNIELIKKFVHSWISMGCLFVATILLPILLYALNHNKKDLTRIIAGAQTGAILIGWFGIRFPVMVEFRDSEPLTIYNAAAPYLSLKMMIIALIFGLAVVIPLLIYLFKVFKFSVEKDTPKD